MKYCIFSDIHGNLINLVSFYEAALKLGIDKFICLGDVCNYYPDNIEVIKFLAERKIICLLGNHDQMYSSGNNLTMKTKLNYNYDQQLLKAHGELSYIKSMPKMYEIGLQKTVLCCHGSPTDFINGYVYPDTDLSSFIDLKYEIIFMGHTHRQFIRKENNITFCNVGSIGLPRDNGSLMGFATYDSDTNEVVLYRKAIHTNKILKEYSKNTPLEVLQLLERKEILLYPYTLINE